ncbi:formylglycine-generating enzyme family protein, partial [Vibrio hyugaensis]|uniref:formylglycine-generating enzyme family protein n=1 Tax=Vibrio hyugaensis TaxID=1534743 RepID=UPI0011B01C8A
TVEEYLLYALECNIDTSYLIEYWRHGKWGRYKHFDFFNDDFYKPIVGVSYIDAQGFISWLSYKDGINYRLPSELEFEVSSRSGCNCILSCKMSKRLGVNEFRTSENDFLTVGRVMSNAKNSFGLYDMLGLIWQWCEDWYNVNDNRYSQLANKEKPHQVVWNGKTFPETGRVIRGGSFSYSQEFSSCSNRHFSFENDRNFNVGFRLVFDEVINK